MLAGQAHFSGCVFIQAAVFSFGGGLGSFVAVIGGLLTTTFCTIHEFDLMGAEFGAGSQFFVGGGCDVHHACAGIGNHRHLCNVKTPTTTTTTTQCNTGGVHVMTGVHLMDSTAMEQMAGTGSCTVAGGACVHARG